MASFNIDEGALHRAVNQGLRQKTAEVNRDLNALTPAYTGKPLEEIKREVQRVWGRHFGGGRLPEDEVSQFAQIIHDGGRVEARTA